MDKFKTNVLTVMAGTQISFNEMKEGIMNPSKKTKLAVGAILSAFIIALSTTFALATTKGGDDVWDKINSALGSVYTGVISISTGIFVVCAIVGLIAAQVTTNQQKTMKWLDFVKKAAVIWAIILGLAFITKFIKSIVGDATTVTDGKFDAFK